MGVFDVLVGINLLREGLDIPEITLVAILDADKEGFLRSETSLVQTIGRAARNSEGHVIMYADHMTDSMHAAITETERRREIQDEYNKEHGITPQTIKKDIRDLIKISDEHEEETGGYEKDMESMSKKELKEVIERLSKKMNQAVCRYGTEHHIWSMGSTMAMLLFTPESMFACNLGDSRIYFMDGGKLQQISTDHVFGGTAVGKAPLTQYLGLPEELQRLEPSVTEIEHKEGYRYLLCSDGVTDMLSDSEIEAILSQDMEIPEIVNDLLKNALQKGGRDNVTIVLCEVQKLDTVRRMKEWMKNLKDKK